VVVGGSYATGYDLPGYDVIFVRSAGAEDLPEPTRAIVLVPGGWASGAWERLRPHRDAERVLREGGKMWGGAEDGSRSTRVTDLRTALTKPLGAVISVAAPFSAVIYAVRQWFSVAAW
jgi:hypothetical protein